MERNLYFHTNKLAYKDRCKNLGQQGIVLWFTGLSGSGKSTISSEVEYKLASMGKTAYRLDGDNLRMGLNKDLTFTEESRYENIRRISEVAALFKDAGIITLVSVISPYAKMRHMAKEIIGENHFIEIYVKTDIKTCIKRDPKGLYKKALSGEIPLFTGVSDRYEEPKSPDVLIQTDKLDLLASSDIILQYLIANKFIVKG